MGLADRIFSELECIPRGGVYQTVFRAKYYSARFEDFITNPTVPAQETVKRLTEDFKRAYPAFEPMYDQQLFAVEGGESS